jgi:hypothetical protein
MSNTNCGPNFIGPQGIAYTTIGPSCGPTFVGPFPQPYQLSPSFLISKKTHLPAMAPSPIHVLEQRIPIMFVLFASAVIRNETSTQLLESKARAHKQTKKRLMILRWMNDCLEV